MPVSRVQLRSPTGAKESSPSGLCRRRTTHSLPAEGLQERVTRKYKKRRNLCGGYGTGSH
uniref:Uncharacterized protein n=1 Tax=Oryza punctata TaxID=4537 RepID=A0A0E0MGU3_ORYPU